MAHSATLERPTSLALHLSKASEALEGLLTMVVACFVGPTVIESVHSTTTGHLVRGEETSYWRILKVGEDVKVWCELKTVAGVMENLGIQWDFIVCLEVRRSCRNENVDAGLMLFSVSGFVCCRGLS